MKFDQDLRLHLRYDFGKMNSTLGFVVPLAMFFLFCSLCSWLMTTPMTTRAKKDYGARLKLEGNPRDVYQQLLHKYGRLSGLWQRRNLSPYGGLLKVSLFFTLLSTSQRSLKGCILTLLSTSQLYYS